MILKTNISTDFEKGFLKNGMIFSENGQLLGTPVDLKDISRLNHNLEYPVINNNDNTVTVITFVELRGKSDYSIGDAVTTIKEIVNHSEVGIGLNDHGVGYGLYAFNQEALKQNKKPIIGAEIYLSTEEKYVYNHLVLIAKNREGYKELSKVLTLSSYHKIQDEMLETNNKTKKLIRPSVSIKELESNISPENFIVLSAYSDSEISTSPYSKRGEELLNKMIQLFGDDFYLEIQYQEDETESLNNSIEKLAEDKNLKIVLTNDYHQATKDDTELLKLRQSIHQKEVLDESTWHLSGEHRYIHTSQEIEEWKVNQKYTDHTIEIFNKIEIYNLYSKENYSPKFPIPEGYSSEKEYFQSLTRKGLEFRFKGEYPKEYSDRLEYELDIIDKMGFNGYFLIVADFINYAKRNYDFYDQETSNRWKYFIKRFGYKETPIAIGPGRGSAAGSLVAYSLAITELDPLKYGLLFERFLNPERVSMPDIDSDIPDEKRAEVINYVRDFYNTSKDPTLGQVSGIGTFGTYQIKNAIKSTVRGLYNKPLLAEDMAKLADDVDSFEDYLNKPEVLQLANENSLIPRVLKLAPKLYNRVSNITQHAAAYVISPKPTTEFLPTVFLPSKKTESGFDQLTAFSHVEDNGLLKMDFLGLKAMDVIQESIDKINKDKKENLTVHSIFEKAEVDINCYKTISEGKTLDLFQLGSEGMTNTLVQALSDINKDGSQEKALNGDYFNRLIAGIAMYRPGPLDYIPTFIKNALYPENIEYKVPELKDILESSYGLLIYQESIMSLLQKIGGFSLGKADEARRAIGKKKIDVLLSLKDDFISGGMKNNKSEDELLELWDDIEKFASYGFNKSHAAVYAYIAIVQAWLATYYPTYLASETLAKSESDPDYEKQLLSYYKSLGYELEPPSLNDSGVSYTATDKGIRLGFSGVKYLASNAPFIVKEREAKGNFKNIFDFINRMSNLKGISFTKTIIQSLTYSGALDEFGYKRLDLINASQKIGDLIKLQKNNQNTIFEKYESLFDLYLDPKGEEMVLSEKYAKELEYAKMYVSGHPVSQYTKQLSGQYQLSTSSQIIDNQGGYYNAVLIISSAKIITTKTNKRMAFLTLSDQDNSIEVVCFPDQFSQFGRYIEEGLVVLATIEKNAFKQSFILKSLKPAEKVGLKIGVDHLMIKLPSDKEEARKLIELLEKVIARTKISHPNFDKIKVAYQFNNKEFFATKKYNQLSIPLSLEVINLLKSKFGEDNLILSYNTDSEKEEIDLSLSIEDLII